MSSSIANAVQPDSGVLHVLPLPAPAMKIEDDASKPRHIVTIYGTGCKLVT
jgi:hypothetical protein